MSNNLQKIWRAEVAKIRRCEAAGRVSENLASRRSEDPKMRSCGEGFIKSGREETNTTHYSKKYVIQKCPQNICPYSATKIRRSEDARPEQCPPSATVLHSAMLKQLATIYLDIYTIGPYSEFSLEDCLTANPTHTQVNRHTLDSIAVSLFVNNETAMLTTSLLQF